jgi:hypothetical protein
MDFAEQKLWRQVATLLAEAPKSTNGQLQARLIMLLRRWTSTRDLTRIAPDPRADTDW